MRLSDNNIDTNGTNNHNNNNYADNNNNVCNMESLIIRLVLFIIVC